MDDFNVQSLNESKNEWSVRLINILTPLIIDGYKSILEEAVKLCKENGEYDKYLMTFQNFISRVPKWTPDIIERERTRICEKSGCNYLEDLVVCIHIIQLKMLTAVRVGQKQKKIDLTIPKLDDFIHKVYIQVARKLYKNVYLFELGIAPLQIQKNHRELELMVQECILNTVRESIPVEAILKAYMDETVEEDVQEEVKEQVIEEPIKNPNQDQEVNNSNVILPSTSTPSSTLSFDNIDYARDETGIVEHVEAPKTIDRLEEISEQRAQQRKLESDEDDDDEKDSFQERLKISDQTVDLTHLDIHSMDPPEMSLLPDLLIDDIEMLE
jgi:hypothetical protein